MWPNMAQLPTCPQILVHHFLLRSMPAAEAALVSIKQPSVPTKSLSWLVQVQIPVGNYAMATWVTLSGGKAWAINMEGVIYRTGTAGGHMIVSEYSLVLWPLDTTDRLQSRTQPTSSFTAVDQAVPFRAMDISSTKQEPTGKSPSRTYACSNAVLLSPRLIRLINVINFSIHDIALVDCKHFLWLLEVFFWCPLQRQPSIWYLILSRAGKFIILSFVEAMREVWMALMFGGLTVRAFPPRFPFHDCQGKKRCCTNSHMFWNTLQPAQTQPRFLSERVLLTLWLSAVHIHDVEVTNKDECVTVKACSSIMFPIHPNGQQNPSNHMLIENIYCNWSGGCAIGSLGADTDISKITYSNIYTWQSNQMFMIKSNGGSGTVSTCVFENFIGHR
jgi:hypothetical protein